MRKVLKRSYQVLFLLLFCVVVVRAAMSMFEQSKAATVVLLPFLAFVFLYLPGKLAAREIPYKKHWIVIQCISVLVMLTEMCVMELKLSWDWIYVIRAAYQNALGLDASENFRYFASYSNNRFWLACLIYFFKVVHKIFPFLTELRQYKWVSMLLSGFMTQATLWLIYQTARELFSEKKAFLTGLLAMLFLPFYLYAKHAYTDVPAMFCTAIILFSYAKLKRGQDGKRRIFFLVLIGLAAGFGFKVKATVAIPLIAIFIEELLTTRKAGRFLSGILIVGAMVALMVFCANFLTRRAVVISDEMVDRYEFPVTHWIMMGLRGNGGYNLKDVERTMNCETYAKRVEMNMRVIRKRLKRMGPAGLLEHIFFDKMDYTWGRSCLAGDYYGTKHPFVASILWHFLSVEGKGHWVTIIFTWPYYILILLGILASAFKALRKKAAEASVFDMGRLTILGLTLFLFIWECNSRYLLCIAPIMIVCSAQGLFEIEAQTRRLLGKVRKNA